MKKILLIILILLIASPVQAQDATGAVAKDKWFGIEDFSKGLKSHISPYLIPNGGSTLSQNVRYNKRYGSLAKRDKMLQLSACRAFPVKSLFRYYKSDATKYAIETSSTFMDYITDATGSCINLTTGLSDSKRWNWVTYKDVAIGTNGTDRPKKWDGKLTVTANTDAARTAGDLVAELGAPFAELNTGTDLDSAAWYIYKVAFYDGTTYKFSNARSNPILTGSTVYNITLTDIPIGPSGTTSRIIYRTEGQASRALVLASTSWYKVATIADNTTRTYNDAITDVTILLDPAPTWATVSAGINVSPPYGKYSLIHKERLFIANDISGTTSGKSTLYWSDVFNPDYLNTPTDYEVIRPDDGDQITAIRNDPTGILIGKETSWSKFYTDASSSANWTIGAPFSSIGCIAPYSVANTQTGIIFLGRHGLYTLNGQSVELISDSVTDIIRDILATNQNEIVGIWSDNEYNMAYTSSSSGAGENDRVLILDLIRNSYTQDTKNIDSWADFESGNDFGTLYSGSSLTDGKVYAHSGAFDDLIFRYKSQFTAGTKSNVYIGGDQENPYVQLGWDETWATVAGAWSGQGSSTWLVESNTGTWTSSAIEINATALDKIYWNETLGSAGDVTFAVKLASTEGGLGAASYSSEFTNPSGSDISGVTANSWIQIRASFSTSDYTLSPQINLEDNFVFHMTYQKVASTGETSILSMWRSGFSDLGCSENPNRIKEIQVFYEGTSGTLNLAYENDSGTSYDFDIDLSVLPSASATDTYFGNSTEKYFDHIPTIEVPRTGRKWRFTTTESGATAWKINRILVRTDCGAYTVPR